MKNLPKKIYLNFGDAFFSDVEYDETDFKDLVDVTWCEDKIDEYDHCYIDDSEIEKLETENAELKAANNYYKSLNDEKFNKGFVEASKKWETRFKEIQAEVERLKMIPSEILAELRTRCYTYEQIDCAVDWIEIEEIFAKYEGE